MKIILIYDIVTVLENEEKKRNVLNKVRKICTKYLRHIQNSVFEGELEAANLFKLKKELKTEIDENIDSIIIFELPNTNFIKKEIIGLNKNEFDGFNI